MDRIPGLVHKVLRHLCYLPVALCNSGLCQETLQFGVLPDEGVGCRCSTWHLVSSKVASAGASAQDCLLGISDVEEGEDGFFSEKSCLGCHSVFG